MKAVRLPFCSSTRSISSILRKRPRACPANASNGRSFSSTPSCLATRRDDHRARGIEDAQLQRAQRQFNELQSGQSFQAAPEIDFSSPQNARDKKSAAEQIQERRRTEVKNRFRLLPASPSYFDLAPNFTDQLIAVEDLARRHLMLPVVTPSEAPNVKWMDWVSYNNGTSEPVRYSRYKRIITALKRMNQIQPAVMPDDVRRTLNRWTVSIASRMSKAPPAIVDEDGVSRAIGKRKSSAAKAWVVEGEGEVLINGKPLNEMFARVHDRESVIWALKATQRTDRYNVFATVNGGGTTGQAEALTLAVAKALIAHEPPLKTILRKAGCVQRDPRRVERKKPGRLKARKKPAWVKR